MNLGLEVWNLIYKNVIVSYYFGFNDEYGSLEWKFFSEVFKDVRCVYDDRWLV